MAARKAPVVVVAALAAGLCPAAWGQSARAFAGLPEEAPESLVALELGDASVSLEIEGFWEASATGSLAAAWSGAEGLVLSAPVPLFAQTPDLWLSLVVAERWFLEARADPAGTVDEFALGWRGDRADFLDEVRAGNTGIGIPVLPGLSLGPGVPGLFGVALRASDGDAAAGRPDTVRVFAAVRYEQAALRSRVWRGDRAESVATVPATAYVRDRFFVLPSDGVADLALYLESAAGPLAGGDGRRYRRLGADEYALDATDGLVDLRAAAKGRLLAAWTGGSDDAELADGVAVSVDGRSAVLLFDPDGDDAAAPEGSSPVHYFQSLGRYPVPEDYRTAATSVDLVDLTSGLPDLSFALPASADGAVAELVPEGMYDPRSAERRRPLVSVGMDRIYLRASDDPDLADAPSAPTRALRFRTLGPPGAYELGAGVVPGSVEVRRNGLRETLWTLEGNAVVLVSLAAASDEIEIRWLEASADRHDGTVAAAAGAEFPGAETRAWTGLGARWGIPGTGYSEAGGASLASIDLAGGIEGALGPGEGKARLAYSADARAGWRSGDSTGHRLVSGMDEDPEWELPYRLADFDDTIGATTTLERREDTELAEAFPDSAGRYVSGATNHTLAFVLDATSGAPAAAERVVEAVPLGEYRTFVFWYRAIAITGSGTPLLRVRLVSGASDALLVELPLPAGGESAPWTRVELALDAGPAPTVRSASGDREEALPVPGALAAVDRARDPGLVRIEVEGVGTGTVELDALSLEDPVSGFLALGRAGAAWSSPGPIEAAPFLSGASLAFEGSGEAFWTDGAFEGALAGRLDGAIAVGALELQAGARGYLAPEGGPAPRLALEHGLSLPAAGPFGFGERFSSDPAAGRLSRKDTLALALGDALRLSVEGAAGVLPAAFSQDWNATLGAGAFSASATAGLASTVSPIAADLPYHEAWLGSWALLLPAGEAGASLRTLGAGIALAPGGRELMAFDARLLARPASLRVESALAATLRRRFDLGGGASLEPAYSRKALRGSSAPGASFREDLSDFGAAIAASPWLWEAFPFHELFDPDLYARFEAGTRGAADASWSAEASLDFARRYGSRILDLFLPSEARVALRRELARNGDSVSDLLVIEGGTGGAALDLFGSSGSRPLASAFEYDEYALRSSFALRLPADGSGASAKASASALATFSDSGGQEWRFEERAVLDLARDGTTWSNTLGWSAALRPDRTWLSELLDWVLVRALPGAPAPESASAAGGEADGKGPGVSVVSDYLVLVAGAPRVPVSSLALALELSSPERSGGQFVAKLKESWAEKVTARERLVVETKLTLAQGVSVEDGVAMPFAELAASLSLKVIF